MPRLGVITGTRREVSCLRNLRHATQVEIACSGADSGRAAELAELAVAEGCTALLSFGVAGGLDPSLASGTLVLMELVISPDGGKYPTDPSWRSAVAADLKAARIDFATGTGMGVDEVICHPEPKRLLHEGTKALCVDMESHAVTGVARKHGVPLLVLRAIADGANDALPDIATAAIGDGGEVLYGTLMTRLLRRPSELADLIRLWRISRLAFAALSRVASLPSLRGPL